MKELVICVFLLFAFTAECVHLHKHRPFQSRKSPSEIIKEYEVILPVVSNGSEISHEGPYYSKEISVTVSHTADKGTYNLSLYLNEMLLGPAFASGQYINGERIEEIHDNCFYHGTVEGHEDWSAAFSTCYGLRGWFGSLSDSSNLYHIEPIEDTPSFSGPHALYLDSQHQNSKHGTCGTSRDHEHEILDIGTVMESSDHHLIRKRAVPSQMRIVEWLLVNDYYQYMNYDSNITAVTHRAIELANHVDLLYDQLNISIVLVYSLTWTEGQNITYSSDPNTLLNLFKEYHRTNTDLKDIVHDSTMLITGIDIDGSVVGLATINKMCDYIDGVGFTQDTGGSVMIDGTTAAHELGHIFNMLHDDAASCMCPDSVEGCIMNAFIKEPDKFSQCSLDQLAVSYSQGKDSCLFNHPTTLVGDPVCGNGIREPGEVCDCGSVQDCQDPCCNAATCTLTDGSECGEGECCENCMFKEYGTVCREAGDTAGCGITEYCTGKSSDCPRNVHLQDGTLCNNGTAYCFDGDCPTLTAQCKLFYGNSIVPGVQECYDNYNAMGVDKGHCGVFNSTFIACDSENVNCGSIQCTSGSAVLLTPVFANIQTSNALFYFTSFVFSMGVFEYCSTFTTSASVDEVSPGLISDGTKCAENKLCLSQKCIDISSLGVAPCPVGGSNSEVCSGNGVCNNLDQCSCNIGFSGTDCSVNATDTKLLSDPPVISPNGTILDYVEGDNVTLTCTGDSDVDDDRYQWTLPDASKKPDNPVNADNGLTLTLNTVTRTDSGLYTCTGTVQGDTTSVESNVTLNIQYPAKVLSFGPVMGSAMIGSTLTLNCSYEGNPTPSVSWSHKGTPLDVAVDSALSQTITDGYALLEIQLNNDELFGGYTCIVNNNIDSTENMKTYQVILPESTTTVVNSISSTRRISATNLVPSPSTQVGTSTSSPSITTEPTGSPGGSEGLPPYAIPLIVVFSLVVVFVLICIAAVVGYCLVKSHSAIKTVPGDGKTTALGDVSAGNGNVEKPVLKLDEINTHL